MTSSKSATSRSLVISCFFVVQSGIHGTILFAYRLLCVNKRLLFGFKPRDREVCERICQLSGSLHKLRILVERSIEVENI